MGRFDELTERVRRKLSKKHAYDAVFKTPGGNMTESGVRVLRDLAQFSGAYVTTTKFSPITRTVDPLASAVAEGRRQVFLHLMSRLRLDTEEILKEMEDIAP